MPRREDRHGSNTRLYVGHLSSRTRTRDLEHVFSRYGRVRDVDMKRDYAFVEFSNPRDADDARYHLDNRDVDGRRITVEFAKGMPRGPGGVREYAGRGPVPGSGRCFNCGIDGHWARDCTAGDWKNKCYRCGERGHVERNCQNSPKKPRHERSYSRSPVRSRSPRRDRSRSRSFSKSRSYSRSRSPPKRGRDVEYDERRSMSPTGASPAPKRRPTPSKSRKRSPTPIRDSPGGRGSRSPRREVVETGRDGYGNTAKDSPSPGKGERERDEDGYRDGPKETSRSPVSPSGMQYEAANGTNLSPSPSPSPLPNDDGSPVDDDEDNARFRRARGSP